MKPIHDNTVDLFYVADRLVNILDVDDKNLRKEVEEFREEIFHNNYLKSFVLCFPVLP